jgi:hypothetical protein
MFFLELHLVRELSFAEGKVVPQILPEHGGFLVLLDHGQHHLVDVGLVLLPLVRGLVALLLGLKDITLLLGSLLVLADAAEVGVVDLLGHLKGKVGFN